jgi:hypothetical protein
LGFNSQLIKGMLLRMVTLAACTKKEGVLQKMRLKRPDYIASELIKGMRMPSVR